MTSAACALWGTRLTEPTAPQAPEPNRAFEDSRRLTGPNRWLASTAVVLTPLGPHANYAAAHARWAAHAAALCTTLGWPGARPLAHRHASGTLLVMAAPADRLYTATEVNEWAWERAFADAASSGIDLEHDYADEAANVFAQRAATEAHPALLKLHAAASAHGLPMLVDDTTVSIGAGAGSRCWPRAVLPAAQGVPWSELHDVPTAIVTGSNGKTTTVRLIAAMCAAAGLAPGYCCTEGVFVSGHAVALGDYAGPAGARAVLRHGGVQAAILETARGGLLRRGLAVQRANVAVVTNISPDHLGEYGVHSAADLAEVKLTVARAVVDEAAHGATLVLNADDAVLLAAAARLPHAAAARQALFAHAHAHPALVACRQAGGSTCGVQAGRLLLSHAGALHDLGEVAAMPFTLGGAARHNVHNAAAAALAAVALKLPLAAVMQTLQVFGASAQDNPGRLERWAYRGATVLVDYAHNPDGLAQLLQVARSLVGPGPGRLGLLLGQAGNRGDAAIAELARTAARYAPQRVLIKELPHMLRGRALGEVPALLTHALHAAGIAAERVLFLPDEAGAAHALLAWAQPGDVVVLPVHTTAVREQLATFLSPR